MREFAVSLGYWGPLAVMPLLFLITTAMFGYRKDLGFSLRFGAICGLACTVGAIIGTYVHPLACVAFIAGAVIVGEKTGFFARYGLIAKRNDSEPRR